MQLIDHYFEARQALYNYFDYEPDWSVYPISDCRSYWWFVLGDVVVFYDTLRAYETTDEAEMYSAQVLRGRVFIQTDLTAIEMDTHSDGNSFLAIFDNLKSVPPKEYVLVYL